MLSLAGAAAGMALAEGLLRIFVNLAPTGIPFLKRSSLDLRIVLFTILLSLVCAGIFGLLPALETPRVVALASCAAKSRRRTLLRQVLVAGQIDISMVLLSSAALLLKSFQNLEEQRLGIEAVGVFTVQIALPHFRYNTPQKVMDLFSRPKRRCGGFRESAPSQSAIPCRQATGRAEDAGQV